MKRRVRKIVNFFAFNLLFFALYLNFVHKDNPTLPVSVNQIPEQPAAFSGTVPVENTEKYADKKTATPGTGSAVTGKETGEDVAALKLSIN
jgi:hypothetical protein